MSAERASEVLPNYGPNLLAADIKIQKLRVKHAVKVLCASSGEWMFGMIKTVDHSGVLVATVQPNGRRSGEMLAWDAVEGSLAAIKEHLPADFDDRSWTNEDWLTPKARDPPKPRAPKTKMVAKPASKGEAGGAGVRSTGSVQKKKIGLIPVVKLRAAAQALGVAAGSKTAAELCDAMREKLNEIDGADA